MTTMTSLRPASTRFWLIAMGTVTAGACGGTATQTPAPTSGSAAVYPCNLVTTSQVERVGVSLSQGIPVLATSASGRPTDPGCTFVLSGPHPGTEHVPVGQVQITMVTAAEFARCHVDPLGGGISRPIHLSSTDEAVLVWGPGFGSVCARRGGTNYIVLRPGQHEDSFVEQAVAEAVAAHLK